MLEYNPSFYFVVEELDRSCFLFKVFYRETPNRSPEFRHTKYMYEHLREITDELFMAVHGELRGIGTHQENEKEKEKEREIITQPGSSGMI